MTAPSSTTTCAACGATASGNFCASCGASLAERACAHCRAPLSPQARFCHRCGQPAAGAAVPPAAPAAPAAPASRTPWLVAAGVIALLLGAIIYKVWSDAPTPAGAPVMANAGNAGNQAGAAGGPGAPAGPMGPAPDISKMSPRERFDRLFNRVMEAAERGDTSTVFTFTPMALGAYAQLDTVDADARYHAAVLQMQVGEFAPALALADTILAEQPGHLFGYVVRGTVAGFRNDAAALARARRDFQANDARETAAKRVEYLEHKPILDEFRTQAGGR